MTNIACITSEANLEHYSTTITKKENYSEHSDNVTEVRLKSIKVDVNANIYLTQPTVALDEDQMLNPLNSKEQETNHS